MVARKRRKSSDDPRLGSTATGSNDGLLPSNQPANSESSSREPYDPLTRAQSNGTPVRDVDGSKRRSSRRRRSRPVVIHTILEPIPEHEQWELFMCSSDDDMPPLPENFHAWYQNRRHRRRSTRISISAGRAENPVEEPPASLSSDEEGPTDLRDIVNHHDTGPRDSTNIDKRPTHLVQMFAPILLRKETKPSVMAQHAESADVSATASAT